MDWAAGNVFASSGIAPEKVRDFRKVLEDPSIDGVILETQRRTGAVLQVGSQRRSSRSYADAVAFLRSGAIGEPKWAKCWFMSNRASIGKGKESPVPEWLDWDLWQGPAPRTAFSDNFVHYNWHWFRRWGTAETGNNMPHYTDVADPAQEVRRALPRGGQARLGRRPLLRRQDAPVRRRRRRSGEVMRGSM